ncbi:MAG: hypothetical protein JXM79_19990 [Sedimentisphaerales bacterium]|nr:hypothetical protein [Sedimentisphaerales bacterium]
MRTVSLIICVFAMVCLSVFVSGCGTENGMQAQSSCCGMWTTVGTQGYQCAVKYREGALPAYRLVIALNPLSEHERNEFLRGFRMAYFDADDDSQGQLYTEILRQSLEGGYYTEAVMQGKKYVNGQTTDARVQELIGGSVGLTRGADLGWKAGYIAGFAREMARQRTGSEEIFYQEAETKYNALRGALGV